MAQASDPIPSQGLRGSPGGALGPPLRLGAQAWAGLPPLAREEKVSLRTERSDCCENSSFCVVQGRAICIHLQSHLHLSVCAEPPPSICLCRAHLHPSVRAGLTSVCLHQPLLQLGNSLLRYQLGEGPDLRLVWLGLRCRGKGHPMGTDGPLASIAVPFRLPGACLLSVPHWPFML